MRQNIWLTWENQRRSVELSRALGCKLFLFDIPGKKRYPLSILKTIFVFIRYQKAVIYVQNPSMFLAAMACLLAPLTRSIVIVDRHTTFRLNKPHTGSFSIWLFMRLHYYTLAKANLTIVTNQFLADLVEKANGNPFVLPDKLPDLNPKYLTTLSNKTNVLFISSFGNDEPVTEVITAAKNLTSTAHFYITGNYRKRWLDTPCLPVNVTLSGFLPEEEYISYLFSCDIVLVLTQSDYCLLCGCYEAIAAEKPLITSDKKVLREYFPQAFFVDNTPSQITSAINAIIPDISEHKNRILQLKRKISLKWNIEFTELEKRVRELEIKSIQSIYNTPK